MGLELHLNWSAETLRDEMRLRTESSAQPRWRIVSLACWGTLEDPRFASVWWTDGTPHNQEIVLRKSRLELVGIIDGARKRGMLPIIVTSVGEVEYPFTYLSPCYTVVFERAVPKPNGQIYYFTDFAFDSLSGAAVKGSPDLATILQLDFAYLDDMGVARYCGVTAAPPKIAENFGTSVASAVDGIFDGDTEHQARRRGWARPEMAVPTLVSRPRIRRSKSGPHLAGSFLEVEQVVALWRDEPFVPWPADMADPDYDMGATVRGPLRKTDITTSWLNGMRAQGWILRHVGAKGAGSRARFYLTFSKARRPLRRQFIVVNAAEPSAARVPPLKPFQVNRDIGDVFLEIESAADIDANADLDSAGSVGASSPNRRDDGRSRESAAVEALGSPVLRAFRRLHGAPAHYVPPYDARPARSTEEWDPEHERPRVPPPEPPPVGPYAELDIWVYDQFVSWANARAVQIVIAHEGKIVCCRSYTWAEEGYPITQARTRYRIASVSKGLLPLPFLSKLGAGGLDKSLAAYGISGSAASSISSIPVRQLLNFVSGLGEDYDEATVADTARPTGANKGPPAQHGDMQAFLSRTTLPLTTLLPHVGEFKYSNFGGSLAGELASAELSPAGLFDDYPATMQQFLQAGDDPVDGEPRALNSPSQRAAYVARGGPMHAQGFGTARGWRRGDNRLGKLVLDSVLWTTNLQWKAPSGGWAMSAATLVRVLCGLEEQSLAPKLLTAEQTRAIYQMQDPAAAGVGLIWSVIPVRNGVTQMVVGGALPGMRTSAVFESGPYLRGMVEKAPGWSAAMFVNGDGRAGASAMAALAKYKSLGLTGEPDLLPDLFPDLVGGA